MIKFTVQFHVYRNISQQLFNYITEAIVYTISGSLIFAQMRAGLICFL